MILASHILPVLNAPLPDPFLRDLLLESYPRIVAHARLLWSWAYPNPPAMNHQMHSVPTAGGMGFLNVLTSVYGAATRAARTKRSFDTNSQSKAETEMERRLQAGRWAWSTFAIVGLFGYALSQGIIVIERVGTGPDA